jgi:hypothetical protein
VLGGAQASWRHAREASVAGVEGVLNSGWMVAGGM